MAVVRRSNAGYNPAVLLLEAIEDVAVVLALQVAQELKEDHESDHGDAGPEEARMGRDAPVRRDEAGIDCEPVPEHLAIELTLSEWDSSHVAGIMGKKVEEETH